MDSIKAITSSLLIMASLLFSYSANSQETTPLSSTSHTLKDKNVILMTDKQNQNAIIDYDEVYHQFFSNDQEILSPDTVFVQSTKKNYNFLDSLVETNFSKLDTQLLLKSEKTTSNAASCPVIDYTLRLENGYFIYDKGTIKGLLASVSFDEKTGGCYFLLSKSPVRSLELVPVGNYEGSKSKPAFDKLCGVLDSDNDGVITYPETINYMGNYISGLKDQLLLMQKN